MSQLNKALILGVMLGAIAACSKLNQENYDMLKLGMSQEEIETVIGSAKECSETLGTRSCVWGNEEGTYIKVTFVADNAATFSNNGLK